MPDLEMNKQLSLIREESEHHGDAKRPSFVRHERVDEFDQNSILETLIQTSDLKDKVVETPQYTIHEETKVDVVDEVNAPLIAGMSVSNSNDNSCLASPDHTPVVPRRSRRSNPSLDRLSMNLPSTHSSPMPDRSTMKKRLSMPVLLVRKGSGRSRVREDSTSSTESRLDRSDREIFEQLDKLDGKKNGKISKSDLQKYISSSVQDLRDMNFTKFQPVSSEKLSRLLSEVDANNDGHIDEEEFEKLVQLRQDDTRPEVTTLFQYLKTAAFAEVYKWWPPPLFLLTLSLVQLAFFIIHAVHLSQEHGLEISWGEPAPRCSMLIYNPYRRWEAWRFLSYSLVHAGIGHITLNLIMQLLVGLPLEMSHGSPRIGVVYSAGVLAGSLVTSAFDPNMYLAGASSGVYSLITTHLASLILNWKEDVMIIRQSFRQINTRRACSTTVYRLMRLLSVVIYAACDIGYAVYARHMRGPGTVGNLAHLAGAIAGLFVGLSVLRNRKEETWEIFLRLISSLFMLSLATVAVVWNIKGNDIYQKYYGTQEPYFLPTDTSPVNNCSYLLGI